ncbi:helix-turn-helix domain-containing protein [Maridesulfovibrio sp.]|uniref:helix-turn-helix domain-containing protein n=1 Tax=Maridesulfovibrio sp. TaxID=2795000 RepID=UPI002AA6EF44|nr:helix-turn-helix domain-containing protein [Maridesulfovibrio sp.]
MTERHERRFLGVWIPKEIWLSEELTLQEKAFLAEIQSLDNEDGCYASNGYFAKFFDLSKTRVSLVIKSLVEKKYVTSEIQYKEGTKEILKRVLKVCYIPPLTKVKDPSLRNLKDPPQGKLKDNNTGNSTEDKKHSPDIVKFVQTFQDYVSEVHGVKAPKVTDSLLRKGEDVIDKLIRLDGFTLDQVRNSLRWAVKDDFWAKNVLSLASLRKKSKNNDLTKMQNIFASWERNAGQGTTTQGPEYITDQTDLYGNG